MKQNQYRLKDKKALIYRNIENKSNIGNTTMQWQPISEVPLWCFTQNLSGNITNNQLIIENEETRLFVFNYHSDIEQGYLISYGGKWYEITRTNTTGDYRYEVFVYTRDVTAPATSDILAAEISTECICPSTCPCSNTDTIKVDFMTKEDVDKIFDKWSKEEN